MHSAPSSATPRRTLRNALLLGSLFFAAGCARRPQPVRSHEPGGVFYATEQNANQLVRLHPGDKLVVSLPLPNGGQWQLLQSVAPVLLTDYTPPKVSAYEGHIFNGSALSNGRPPSYVFIANAPGAELLQLAPSGATRYTGAGGSYQLRVEVSAAAR